MFMDLEKRARRQSLRIIISEAVMVIAVIAMVTALAFIVSGYWINADFEVERQGMLQVYSVPTGATVSVDGEAPWYQRTNTSKILSGGEHVIEITKEGYDSWSKTISISEGLLYRLNYPYLFPQKRTKESVYDTTTTTFATVSPDRKFLLLANNTTSWKLVNLDSDTIKATPIDISAALTNGTATGTTLFAGKIILAEWDSANSHVLLKIDNDTKKEWLLLDIRNPAKSINLTREYAADFTDMKIFDDSATNLLAMRNGNLHKINVEAHQISAVLAEQVLSYDTYDSEIIYVSGESILVLKPGSESTVLTKIEAGSHPKVLTTKFYDNRYLFTIDENIVTVYLKEDLKEIKSFTINFSPTTAKIGYGGEFVIMNNGINFATLDMESMQLREWEINSPHFGWLNNYMMYSVLDGALGVYDFDGLNHRTLSTNVSDRFPVTITNNKWLYYFSDDQLVREWLIDQ